MLRCLIFYFLLHIPEIDPYRTKFRMDFPSKAC
jgi:hypothetical protein